MGRVRDGKCPGLLSQCSKAETALTWPRAEGIPADPAGWPGGAADGEDTHHRSWAPATRCARPSGRRPPRSWPPRRTGSLCHRSRRTRRSGSCAGRAAGPRRCGRPRTWETSGWRRPGLRTWLWGKEGRVQTAHRRTHPRPKSPNSPRPPRLSQQQKQLLSDLGTMAIFLPQPIFFFDRLQYTINCISQRETVP